LIAAFKEYWGTRHHNTDRVDQLHRAVLVGGRNLALPLEAYTQLEDFGAANDAYIQVAVQTGGEAIMHALQASGLEPADVDALYFTSVTGVAAPSIDARLVNHLGLRSDVARVPMFGLGCVAGAAGVSRLSDYLQAWPDRVAVLLSVELCSLTLQRKDLSVPNLIASGLFGDGAAAVVGVGETRARQMGLPDTPTRGPRVRASRSCFYPDSEDVMGWRIGSDGFQVVLSAQVPLVVKEHIREDVDGFLDSQDLTLDDIDCWVCHPGGPKVLQAFEAALDLDEQALSVTWNSLRTVGNMSSSSVLFVLRDTMYDHRPPPGSLGLMLAMGPGFCSELVLLEW
jgi:alkylresorcinol/alkylpyrone synthase